MRKVVEADHLTWKKVITPPDANLKEALEVDQSQPSTEKRFTHKTKGNTETQGKSKRRRNNDSF